MDIVLGFGTVLSVLGNIFSAVALIMTNKKIVVINQFPYMSFLTGMHFYFSFLVLSLMLSFGIFSYKAVSSYLCLFQICMGSLASIVFMNLNLATNSVGFYQLSKLSCIPITLALETVLRKRQQVLNFQMILSLTLILFGMGIILINELALNTLGLIWAILGVFSTSIAQVLFSPLQKELGLNSMQLLFHTSPILTLGSYLLIPVFDNTKALLNTEISYSLIFNVLFSCMLAVLLNITNYYVLSMTSPLTYQIINHCKTLLILLLGAILYDDIPSSKKISGMILVIVGVVLYTEENRQQQLRKQTTNLPISKIPGKVFMNGEKGMRIILEEDTESDTLMNSDNNSPTQRV